MGTVETIRYWVKVADVWANKSSAAFSDPYMTGVSPLNPHCPLFGEGLPLSVNHRPL